MGAVTMAEDKDPVAETPTEKRVIEAAEQRLAAEADPSPTAAEADTVTTPVVEVKKPAGSAKPVARTAEVTRKVEPVRQFMTSRKMASGLGSAHSGTAAHWSMTVSAVALAILTPLFVALVARSIGTGQAGAVAFFGQPFAAIVTGLFLVVGMIHWIRGTRIMVDDYLRGAPRMWTMIGVQIFGWAVIAAGLYALVRMSLISTLVGLG